MATVRITEFTDPGCPFAWSAEPFRRKLQWRYGDQLEWRRRMVVLADDASEYADKGFTTKFLAKASADLSREHGMPIDTSERERLSATAPACRAVVAARLNAPAAEDALLRALRVRNFAGELLEDESTRAGAARDVGLEPAELETWMATDETERALDEDRAAARSPTPAALAQNHKLAPAGDGRRYTCPSYEIVRLEDGLQIDVPGFQPYAAYEVALANLVPDAELRSKPESVLELLEWAGEPLATREVAVVCEVEHEDARQQLGRMATERHLGFDGLWSPAKGPDAG
jgi:predicted DsbA family dithiol-disulfide isomerase